MPRQKAADLAATQRWVIEGVYGWLAEVAVPRATAFMWLDVPWDVYREGLLARGRRCGGTEADFAELLRWAEAYRDRQTPKSLKGHQSTTIRWNPLPLMICAFGVHPGSLNFTRDRRGSDVGQIHRIAGRRRFLLLAQFAAYCVADSAG
jgi:hypothetical protein